MKKVNWLIEQNIYDRETEFLAQLQKQGYIYQQTKYLNFRPQAAHQYFPLDDCVLFMGTLNFGRDILRTSWIPGAYMDYGRKESPLFQLLHLFRSILVK